MKTLKPNIKTLDNKVSTNNRQRTSSYQWRKLRKNIIERDKYTCQCCGIITTKGLEVDHIDTNPNNNSPDNLQTLCRDCHEKKTTQENKGVQNYLEHLEKLAIPKPISKYDK